MKCPWKKGAGYRPGEEPDSKRKATPLPKIKVIIIGSIVLINNFGAALIFPFLPFMVHDFFPELNKDELGQKAGFLGSAFFAGNFVGSFMWGSISDHWGRRPVMLFGICGTIFSELLFGFSQTFVWAIVARFLWGFLNGNIGVAKTYLSEICDDTNQAQGFSVIGTSSGIGRLLGSVVGGFLAQPASKYHVFEHPFFCQFPYVLPVFVAVGIGIFSFTTGFCFLNETLPKAKEAYKSSSETEESVNSDDTESTITDIEMMSMTTSESESELPNHNGMTRESDINAEITVNDTESGTDTDILIEPSKNAQNGRHNVAFATRVKKAIRTFSFTSLGKKFIRHHKEQCVACCHCYYTKSRSQSLRSLITSRKTWKQLGQGIISNLKQIIRLFLDRRVMLSTVVYGLMGYAAIMTNELFPLLMVTDHAHGGYQMDDNEIATFTMIVAGVQLVYQPTVFPRTAKLLGYRNLLRVSVIIFACGSILLPWSNAISGPIGNSETGGHNETGSGMNPMFNDSSYYDYCGRAPEESSINENSISRIPAKVWAVVLLALLAMIISRASSFTSIMVMVNNSALPETRGLVNGIGQSLVAVARSIGPTNGALLFAWSESNGLKWPLNYHLSFELCFIVAMIVLLVSFLLPKTIEKKRERS